MSDRLDSEIVKSSVVLLQRKLACENTLLQVYFDDLQTPDSVIKNYMVVEPRVKQDGNLAGGVTVLPVREDGAFGLLKLYRHPVQKTVWEAPRGFMDQCELPAISAIREVREEIGLICNPEKMLSLGTILPEAGIIRMQAHLFAAFGFPINSQAILSNEVGHLGFTWFSWEEVQAKVMDSEIEDGATLTILLKLLLLKTDPAFSKKHEPYFVNFITH